MDQVQAILDAGELDRLIGMIEDEFLEAKSMPYDLDSPSGRFELAKDVTAFANASGGHLLIGPTTARETDRPIDRLDSLVLIQEADFSTAKHIGVIQSHVHPDIMELEVSWSPHQNEAGGIGVIRIPPQSPNKKPFLIAKVVEEDQYLKHIVAGYVERVSDANEPLSPARLQLALRKGQDPISVRLSAIEEKMNLLLDQSAGEVSEESTAAILDERIDEIMGEEP